MEWYVVGKGNLKPKLSHQPNTPPAFRFLLPSCLHPRHVDTFSLRCELRTEPEAQPGLEPRAQAAWLCPLKQAAMPGPHWFPSILMKATLSMYGARAVVS